MNNKSTLLANRIFPDNNEFEVEVLNIPAEKRKLITETYDFTVSTINDYINNEHIVIPNFQRGYVWNRTQASRLIESLIIQCPIPVIYLSQNGDETLSVIDGNQRLTSISLFLNNGFPLTGLSTYPELDGLTFSELDPRFQRHIINRTIRCIAILKETHPQIKFDVFERLNTGSVRLNPQELRHGIYNGTLMTKIEELAKSSIFKKLTSTGNDNRMKGDELILRYFTLVERYAEYVKPMSVFLNKYAEDNRFMPENQVKDLANNFTSNLNKCHLLYGDFAFKTFDENRKRLKANTALYEAQMLSMNTVNPTLQQIKAINKTEVINKLELLLQNVDFYNTITKATTDKNVITKRITDYTEFLQTIF
ncbi:GmrSD restriction endonuclease domain-containing protein [Proteiniphilum propionicum]|jgi:hypothetical protein|uniref:GmrSD restriction endonuclease domain-containing protein n=1 Tax=Proteiniphilum propionicum TaxID=2829812 RepID=UPI001EEC6D56|nr:DUF262 domain-containing protein [Proteiniphilum propionicum]MDD4753884.1 DUF262 domain-containing protein [Desulfitobacteriaceae bacterium]ULB33432.1 DUF262 domain-containing protein [Proteiniphilum propionicum]